MSRAIEPHRRARKSPSVRYRGSGTLAMCGAGPHPGGHLFRSLCTLADRFRAQQDDPEAAKIGSVLSLLALYAARPGDRDFRYPFGSFVMDLALEEDGARRALQHGAMPVSGRRVVESDR